MLHCVSTMQKAEPHEAAAVSGASAKAPHRKICFTLSPEIVVIGCHDQGVRRCPRALKLTNRLRKNAGGTLGQCLGPHADHGKRLELRRQAQPVADEAERAMIAV